MNSVTLRNVHDDREIGPPGQTRQTDIQRANRLTVTPEQTHVTKWIDISSYFRGGNALNMFVSGENQTQTVQSTASHLIAF
jgi:hypothetical protein